jgi:hypothetical protein
MVLIEGVSIAFVKNAPEVWTFRALRLIEFPGEGE